MATDSFKSNMKFAVWALLVQFLVQNSRSFLCSYMNNQAKSTQVITAFTKIKSGLKQTCSAQFSLDRGVTAPVYHKNQCRV